VNERWRKLREHLGWLIPVLACWSAWAWVAGRLGADPADAVGLLAPVIATVLLWREKQHTVAYPWLAPSVLLLVYALAFHAVLPLARAALAVTALAAAVSAWRLGTRMHLALWGLLLLALPVIPSLQFYLGFPLRALVAALSAPLLRGSGLSVMPQGACLRWGNTLIAIDAPCSGVQMLWTGFLLVLALAWYRRLSPGRTLLATGGALVFIILGNALRAAALFYPEAGIITAPAWAHSAIGVLVFLAVAAVIVWWVGWLACTPGVSQSASLSDFPFRGCGVAYLLVALLAAVAPLWHPAPSAHTTMPFPGWPARFAGRSLHPLALTPREERFQEGFPGRIARFTDGRHEIVMRWVTRETRLLHPAVDCFRGIGYRITPLPLVRDAQGRCWGAFRAERDPRPLMVRELIYDDAGHTWSDTSAWYWSAALQQTPGPWWAVTMVE